MIGPDQGQHVLEVIDRELEDAPGAFGYRSDFVRDAKIGASYLLAASRPRRSACPYGEGPEGGAILPLARSESVSFDGYAW